MAVVNTLSMRAGLLVSQRMCHSSTDGMIVSHYGRSPRCQIDSCPGCTDYFEHYAEVSWVSYHRRSQVQRCLLPKYLPCSPRFLFGLFAPRCLKNTFKCITSATCSGLESGGITPHNMAQQFHTKRVKERLAFNVISSSSVKSSRFLGSLLESLRTSTSGQSSQALSSVQQVVPCWCDVAPPATDSTCQ